MKRDKIEEKIIEGINHLWGEDVTPETLLADEICVDEIDGVELVMLLEKDFKIHIPDNTHLKWATVQDVIDYVKEHNPQID